VSRFKVMRSLTIPLAVVLIAACGDAGATGAASPNSFPLTLNTAKGKVTIPHQPSRIV